MYETARVANGTALGRYQAGKHPKSNHGYYPAGLPKVVAGLERCRRCRRRSVCQPLALPPALRYDQ